MSHARIDDFDEKELKLSSDSGGLWSKKCKRECRFGESQLLVAVIMNSHLFL